MNTMTHGQVVTSLRHRTRISTGPRNYLQRLEQLFKVRDNGYNKDVMINTM
jgi:hypothetical protein